METSTKHYERLMVCSDIRSKQANTQKENAGTNEDS